MSNEECTDMSDPRNYTPKLNALHNTYSDDGMTYQEYWKQSKENGNYSEFGELVTQLEIYALLRLYKNEGSPAIQEYIEIEINKRCK